MKVQTPGSRIPPFRAAAVTSDLYNSCACLQANNSRTTAPQSILVDENSEREVQRYVTQHGVNLPVEVMRDWYFLGQ